MTDNFRHAQYRSDGTQIDDPQKLVDTPQSTLRTISDRLSSGSLHIAHDGTGQLRAPSYYRSSYRLGSRLHDRIIADGGNYRLLTDGTLVDAHDATLTALINGQAWTASSGNVEELDGIAASRVTLAGSDYAGYGWSDQLGITTFDDIVDAVAGRPFAPEPKTLAAAQRLASVLNEYNLREFVLVNAQNDAWLAPFTALRFPHVLRNLIGSEHSSFTVARAAELKAAGITWVGVDRTNASAVAAAQIASNAGLFVMAGIILRRSHMTPFAGIPVACWVSEDPIWTLGDESIYKRTRTWWGSATPPIGLLASSESFLPPDRFEFTGGKARQVVSTNTARTNLIGSLCPLPSTGTVTINVPFTINQIPTPTQQPWGPIVVLTPTDGPYARAAGETGIEIQLRLYNGTAGSESAGNLRYAYYLNNVLQGTVSTVNLNKFATNTDTGTIQIVLNTATLAITARVLGGTVSTTSDLVVTNSLNAPVCPFLHVGIPPTAQGESIDFGDITITVA